MKKDRTSNPKTKNINTKYSKNIIIYTWEINSYDVDDDDEALASLSIKMR